MSILIELERADFTFLKEKTGATAGNLSVQLNKLKEAGYIDIEKSFKKNYPLTKCIITPKGIQKFKEYITALKGYIDPGTEPGA
jgi:DNA-binding transcriptional ArsR family regulator